ncbi:TetR family transcriptional regulator C-terminal domain-containing protein [Jannaschia sp. W003]|uniref:TetR family transcriptional regulator C-terminal domain-containing protein n=1 Tax=Jannaschia sp. W003 TaxID=2867012 RepID=UPI0021A3D1AD|nr:TetR family transcriptional regulator C-terminal domain-containing protein [Jannaschia sp. W003]UWQ21175.1 TetR family transcriptional regulator C-terminal domain-containing protein [Jannaschia sp. W003]
MDDSGGGTRIQRRNRARILDAAIEVFAAEGFRGATLDGLAKAAGLSKPNLLYYFASKEAVYVALLDTLLDTWLDPLRALDADGEPMAEMLAYVHRKLELARDYPRESRLFAGEILRGAPMLESELRDLRAMVDEKAAVIAGWMEAGRLARLDPHHLVFSIWALTQHYADFEAQVRAVLGRNRDPWSEAEQELEVHFRRVLAP